jgi:DNA adenine methylase
MTEINPAAKRPPVRYVGGKWNLADWIIGFFPPHVHYVEPFCGGASVLFRKYPSVIETINDLDGRIVNFFRVLRERPDELIAAIELTPYAREELIIANGPMPDDPVEAARRYYVLACMAFGGVQMRGTGWRYITNSHGRSSRVVREWRDVHKLELAVNRLRQVQIEHDDALAVISRFDTPATLFFVDPPYVHSTRTEARLRYAHEMDDAAHCQLAGVLNAVRGMVVLSGYRSALYDELFADWKRIDKQVTTNGNGMATESVWLSPRAHGMAGLPLFQVQP